MALPFHFCIVCDRALESSIGGESQDDPEAPVCPAVHFTARGNYGSTLFDPSPREGVEFLEIVVCDWCLRDKADRVRLVLRQGIDGSFAESIKGKRGPGER